MKKIKKETEALPCCKLSKKVNAHLILLILILAGGFYLYNRYWNVAIVNGKGVSRIEYFKTLEQQGGKQILAQMVQETMILREASKKGLKIEQGVIDSGIATIEGQLKTQGQTLEAALTAEGMKKSDLEKQIRLQKIVEALSEPKTEITQAQIDEFLKTNKAQLPTGKTKEELQALAKDELINQAKSDAITTWLENLKKEAKVVYR